MNNIDISEFIGWFFDQVEYILQYIWTILGHIYIAEFISLKTFILTGLIISITIPILFNIEREKSIRSDHSRKRVKKNEE